MYQISSTVLVPQRAGVDDAFGSLDQYGFRPGAARILRTHHVDAAVGVAPIDIIPTVVETDCRSPHAIAVRCGIEIRVVHARQRIIDEFPVNKVGRMQHGQTGHTIERRSRHPIIVARADDIGVGIIGKDDRVLILSIAEIRRPDSLRRSVSC